MLNNKTHNVFAYDFSKQKRDVKVILKYGYFENNRLVENSEEKVLQFQKKKLFSFKECLKCENNESCKILQAIKYTIPHTPWLKFLGN
ncbi:MAG: hypothetical protein JXR30_04100 [Alphaproteobacteria bacterium]|nr:hypothetical protein [Alphaproteobacteria bacterium]